MKRSILMITAILLVLVLVINGCNQNSNIERETISATGTAKVNVLPDEVSVHMAIETSANTAKESEQENARISERVRNELFVVGIPASEVQTSNFNVYPEYDYSSEGRKLIGYKTTNSLIIKTFQLIKIGDIIDAGIKGGATNIYNIQYELSEGKKADSKKEALEKASKDAKEKAEAIASGLGVKLGKIVSVSSQDYYYEPRIAYAGARDATLMEAKAQVDTIIIPTELDTTATVVVAFEIE